MFPLDAPELAAAYPKIRPMRDSLYLEKADGFGEWEIIISPDAKKTMREKQRRDPRTFDVIMKKLWLVFCMLTLCYNWGNNSELSNGHFSFDNQKALFSHPGAIPIFEAKMFRNLRLGESLFLPDTL